MLGTPATEEPRETFAIERELDGLLEEAGLDAEIARHDGLLDAIGIPRPAGSPRPYLCPTRLVPRFERICEVVHRSIERIARSYFVDGRHRRAIPIPPHLRRLVHGRQPYPAYNVFCRFDVHLGEGPDDVRILELNCADPSAIAWHDWMIRAVLGTRAFGRLAARHRLTWRELVPLHWDVLRGLAREGGHRKSLADGLTFAIADASTVRFDFVAFARLYRERGVEAMVCDPSAFSRSGDRLLARGRPATGIVRDTLDEIVPPGKDARATGAECLRDVLEEASAFVVNPTSAVLADQKALLELLSDPKAAPEIPEEDRRVLDSVIPWTRTLRKRRTSEGEAEIDLVPWVLEHRRELVLKPSEGYGGFDVTVGRSVDEATWRERVAKAAIADHPFVVQRHVPASRFLMPPTAAAPRLAAGAAVAPVNLSLWSFRGQFVGAIARASESAVVNVHQGGVLQPVVFYR